MREILFRGKREDNGVWIFGSFHKKIERCFIIPLPIITSQSKVVQENVGQFTGLNDKNGQKIFEGDIVTGLFYHSMPINGVCLFRDGSFGLLWDREGSETFTPFTSMCNVEYEVIGNIHDNYELQGGRQCN